MNILEILKNKLFDFGFGNREDEIFYVAGSQSFGANFGGDQSSTFLGLQQSVSALLSAARNTGLNWFYEQNRSLCIEFP
mgnify:CR=1 FL=1